MRHINALFTAVSGWPTHATVNALRNSKNAEYTIIGVDCHPNVASLNYVDYLYQVPRCSDEHYIDSLIGICEKHNVDIIIPLISEDITPLWNKMAMFDRLGVKVLLSGKDSELLVANDKFLLEEFLLSNGVNIMPKTVRLDVAKIDHDLKFFGYPDKPVAVKLRDGCGAIGFKILDERKAGSFKGISSRELRANPYISKQQLLALSDNAQNRYLLQEYMPGSELGVLCLADHGRTVYALSHENYEMQYATTTDCELVDNKEANAIVTRINDLLRLDGNIGYDFKRDAEGRLRLLEINPRISATVSLAVKAGVNIVEMGVFHALGYSIDENIVPMYGMRMQRVYGTLYTYHGKAYGS